MECNCAQPFIGPSLATSCGGGTFIMFMSLLNTFIRNKCNVSRICERVKPKTAPELVYDFVVIGGGGSGAVVAARLSEVRKWKVLLIEAGNDEPVGSQIPAMVTSFLGNPLVDWMYKTEPEAQACLGNPEKRCSWPRGKVLGGTSVVNGMMYTRGISKDYDNWEKSGCSGWGYKQVLKYFLKSEDNTEIGTIADPEFHEKGGPLTVNRFRHQPELANDIMLAAKELGYPVSNDINGHKYWGFAIAQTCSRNGTRLSSAKAFLTPARNRPNLHIMLNSTVTKLLFEVKGKKKEISGVKFVYNDNTFTVRVKKEVVISGGAINSPQILLVSGIGPTQELEKVGIKQVHELPGVGRNLHNHVAFSVEFQMNLRKDISDLDWTTAMDYMVSQKGPLSSTGMSQVTARLNTKFTDPDGTNPDLQIFFTGYSARCGSTCSKGIRDPFKPDAPRQVSFSPVVLHPKSRGHIGLKTSNPMDPPLIYANYLTVPEDLETLIEGIRISQRLGNTTVLKSKYGLQQVKNMYGDCGERHAYDSDDFWKCAARYSTGPENHQAGSCKMGPKTDPMAVVNNKLQVYGLEGVRVMDASIMPTPISGNPYATCVMIAEKGVDFIKEHWKDK